MAADQQRGGEAVAYSLFALQERGRMFVNPATSSMKA